MIPFIFLYGGGHSVIVDGDCDILRRCNGLVVIIHIISLAICCVLWRQIGGIGPNEGTTATTLPMIMMLIYGARAHGCAKWGPTV